MDEEKLKSMFPRGSRSFFDANPGFRTEGNEPASRPPLGYQALRKEESDVRIVLRYVLYRVRPFDPENKYTATKTITDCLCQIGLLPGDSEREIDLTVEQVKVNHYEEQRTTLEIKYP